MTPNTTKTISCKAGNTPVKYTHISIHVLPWWDKIVVAKDIAYVLHLPVVNRGIIKKKYLYNQWKYRFIPCVLLMPMVSKIFVSNGSDYGQLSDGTKTYTQPFLHTCTVENNVWKISQLVKMLRFVWIFLKMPYICATSDPYPHVTIGLI